MLSNSYRRLRSKPGHAGSVPAKKMSVRTDGSQLVLPQAAQIFLIYPLFSEKSPEDKVELRYS